MTFANLVIRGGGEGGGISACANGKCIGPKIATVVRPCRSSFMVVSLMDSAAMIQVSTQNRQRKMEHAFALPSFLHDVLSPTSIHLANPVRTLPIERPLQCRDV